MKGSTFEADGPAEGFAVCYCGQCRKWSGHLRALAHVPDDSVKITGDLRWFQSSEKARRGFCPACGSALFWKHTDDDHTSSALGAVDGPTGARLKKHIFTADKGDYYEIADDLRRT